MRELIRETPETNIKLVWSCMELCIKVSIYDCKININKFILIMMLAVIFTEKKKLYLHVFVKSLIEYLYNT